MSRGAWLAALVLLAACRPPERADLDLRRAENAAAQGRHDWARLFYHQDFEKHPERLESLKNEGLSWLSGYQQSLSTGCERLASYLEKRPDDVEATRRLVRALVMLGDWQRARERGARLGNEAIDHLLRAEAALELDLEEAKREIEHALALDPGLARAQAVAALVYDRAEDVDAALGAARAAVRLDAFDYPSFYLLARLLRRQGDAAEAQVMLEIHQQLRRLQHDGTMAPLAPAEALAVMSETEPKLPAVPFPWQRRRLELLFEAKQLSEATELLGKLQDDPAATPADRLEMATWAGEAGAIASSRALFEKVLSEHPGERGALASLALLEIERGELEPVRRRLEQGLASDPDFARYHYLRGRVALAEDRSEEALASLREAVLLAPWEWPWRQDLADLLLTLGQSEEARRVVDEAPEVTPAVEAYRQRNPQR